VPGLKVVGSASAFSFKGKAFSIPEIARQLGVTHLIEDTEPPHRGRRAVETALK
jgi:TolB-like protein